MARGNPLAQQANSCGLALMSARLDRRLGFAHRAVVKQALNGNVQATKVLLDRLLGPPQPLDILERLEQLEARMEAKA